MHDHQNEQVIGVTIKQSQTDPQRDQSLYGKDVSRYFPSKGNVELFGSKEKEGGAFIHVR